jgi:Putative metal-binding motif
VIGDDGMFVLALLACGPSDGGLKTYNTEPSVTIQNPVDGASFNEGDTITFQAKAGDDQTASDALTTQWVSDVEGVLDEGTPDASGVIAFATAQLTPASHLISLYVIDEEGLQGQARVAITILDVPEAPTITVVRPMSGDSGTEDEEFEFSAQVADAQDDATALLVRFESDHDGTFCAPTPDSTGLARCAASLTPGTHYVTMSVTDSDGEAGVATTIFAVTALADIDNDGDGWTETQGDCDDTSSANRPGATEVEDGFDNDCDGIIDEGTANYDDDGDGYSENDGDCDDFDPGISPDAIEDCLSAADDNCDGSTSEEDALNCSLYYYDYDGDGFGSDSVDGKCLCGISGSYTSGNNNDCYDYNKDANPGASTYSVSSRGDTSYDWNCDGTETKYWSTAGDSCDFNLDFDNFCEYGEGWSGSVASCGTTKDYITGCEGGFFDCDDEVESRQQQCL